MRQMTKYVGLDVHQATTVAAVREESRRVIARSVLPTDAPALVEFVRGMRGSVHVGRAPLEEADDDWREDRIDEEFADEASWPVPLALVRADLLAGDLRPLYLLWLLSVQCGERRASAAEPPHPPGLERPAGSLWMFAEFLRLNADLLTVAGARRHCTGGCGRPA